MASFKGQKNLRLRLEYNADYIIDFTKPGYITKTIHVNTRVDADRMKYGFDPYKIGVRLFKQYEGVNIVVYNQPVAYIRYLADMDEFGYDTDYTKSILSALSRTEEILEQKAREEVEALKLKEDREKQASLAGKKKEAHVAPSTKPVTAVPEPVRTVAVHDTAATTLVIPVAETAAPQTPETAKSLTDKNPLLKGEDPLGGSDNAGDEERPITGSGDDGAEVQQQTVLNSYGADPAPLPLNEPLLLSKEVQQIIEPNRTITVFRIKSGDQVQEFRNVKYKWGGMFYFMNHTTPISEHLFNYMTSKPGLR